MIDKKYMYHKSVIHEILFQILLKFLDLSMILMKKVLFLENPMFIKTAAVSQMGVVQKKGRVDCMNFLPLFDDKTFLDSFYISFQILGNSFYLNNIFCIVL